MTDRNVHERPVTGKAYKGIAMEGPIARWYTTIRKPDAQFEREVRQVCALLPAGSHILEVAPGPGDMAIELARRGQYRVTGLDISATFVDIARAKASQAGVAVEFQQGNASAMPFASETFDFALCRAAFKNFTQPVQAIEELYRVLKPGGTAVIIDLRGDASEEDIRAEVAGMGLGAINQLMTRVTFKYFLLKNAYTGAAMRQLVAQTSFVDCEIREDAVGMQVWLTKRVI